MLYKLHMSGLSCKWLTSGLLGEVIPTYLSVALLKKFSSPWIDRDLSLQRALNPELGWPEQLEGQDKNIPLFLWKKFGLRLLKPQNRPVYCVFGFAGRDLFV